MRGVVSVVRGEFWMLDGADRVSSAVRLWVRFALGECKSILFRCLSVAIAVGDDSDHMQQFHSPTRLLWFGLGKSGISGAWGVFVVTVSWKQRDVRWSLVCRPCLCSTR